MYLSKQTKGKILAGGPDIVMYLHMQDKLTLSLTNLLLGVESPELLHILSERSENFKTSCILNLHRMWSAYKASRE